MLNKSQVETIRRWLPDDLLVQAQELLQRSKQAIEEQKKRTTEQQHKLETAENRAKTARKYLILAAIILIPASVIFAILAEVKSNEAEFALSQTQRTQSRFLADLSRQTTGSFQPTFTASATTATLLALKSLPDSLAVSDESKLSRPYVQEAEASLAFAVSNLRERLIIKVYESHAYDALFSPDGKRLLTRGWSSKAKLWSSTGELLSTLATPEDSVSDIRFSPNGDTILTGSKQARLWSTESGDLIRQYDGHEYNINSVAFSSDSSTVVTSSGNFARLFDLNTGQLIAVLDGHDDTVWSASYSPDGSKVVTASWDKTARLWNTKSGEELAVLNGHWGVVGKALFNPDGTLVVTVPGAIYGGDEDKSDFSARIWSAKEGKGDQLDVYVVHVLKGHTGFVTDAAFNPKGDYLVTISNDSTARIWDIRTGETVAILHHDGRVNSAVFSPQGKYIATAAGDGSAHVWDAYSGAEMITLRGHESDVQTARFSPDGNTLVTSSLDGTVRLWRLENRQIGQTMSAVGAKELARNKLGGYGEPASIRTVVTNEKSERIVTLFHGYPARLWNLKDGSLIGQLDHPGIREEFTSNFTREVGFPDAFPEELIVKKPHVARDAVFSKNGNTVTTWGTDGAIRVWNAKDSQLVDSLNQSGVMSPDASRVAIAEDDSISIVDLKTGDATFLVKSGGEISNTQFSVDGSKLYVFMNDGGIYFYDAETGAIRVDVKGRSEEDTNRRIQQGWQVVSYWR